MKERRCILSREGRPTDKLVRLVLDPAGVLVPDVAAKLPGRGLWVTANGPLVRKEIENGGLLKAASRSLKTALKKDAVPSDLVDRMLALLTKRCLDRLGLEQRAGNLVTGFDKIRAAVAKLGNDSPAMVLAASDGAADGRRKIRSAVGMHVPVVDLFDREQLSAALGRENVVHVLLLESGGTEKLKADIGRLAGLSDMDETQGAQNSAEERKTV